MSTTTPRINSAMVLQNIGQTVRIVGTVQGYDETKQHLSILASDGGQCNTTMDRLQPHTDPDPLAAEAMRPRVHSCCLLFTMALTSNGCILLCALLPRSVFPFLTPGSVIVIVAAQNVGVTWEAGQVLEIIGQAQGNAQPTITEYTSIPFAKNFGRLIGQTRWLVGGPFFEGAILGSCSRCVCSRPSLPCAAFVACCQIWATTRSWCSWSTPSTHRSSTKSFTRSRLSASAAL